MLLSPKLLPLAKSAGLPLAMDLRGRVLHADSPGPLDAGNYEADIKLGPEDAAKPDLTRRMLNNGEPYTRVSGPLTEGR